MDKWYLLNDDHTVTEIGEDDLEAWGRSREDHEKRVVGKTTLADDAWVSTVFLGINHRFGGGSPPILFETMVFQGDMSDLLCWRYCTWEEAERGHMCAVCLVTDYQVLGKPLEELWNEKQP